MYARQCLLDPAEGCEPGSLRLGTHAPTLGLAQVALPFLSSEEVGFQASSCDFFIVPLPFSMEWKWNFIWNFKGVLNEYSSVL